MPSKKRGQHHGGGGIVPVRCSDKVSEDEMAPPQPQPKGTYSPTATARIELLAGAAANTTLLVACVHQRVLEMFWADGGDLPTQVTVDEVIS